MSKLSIIIPAYNEAKTIRRLVEKIWAVDFGMDYEIIIVDDHSRDRTPRIARILERRDLAKRIRLFRNAVNRGKGFSIREGLRHAAGDFIVVQDADFEYDPSEIPALLKPAAEGRSRAVYGSRFLAGGRPRGMAFPNYIANRVLTWLTNVFYGARLTDMETCYKLLRRDVLEQLVLRASRFDFEPEITSQLLKKGIPIQEIAIRYQGRTAAEGKKIKARDFFAAVWSLLVNRFFR